MSWPRKRCRHRGRCQRCGVGHAREKNGGARGAAKFREETSKKQKRGQRPHCCGAQPRASGHSCASDISRCSIVLTGQPMLLAGSRNTYGRSRFRSRKRWSRTPATGGVFAFEGMAAITDTSFVQRSICNIAVLSSLGGANANQPEAACLDRPTQQRRARRLYRRWRDGQQPATRVCRSADEAREWIEAQATALNVGVEWLPVPRLAGTGIEG